MKRILIYPAAAAAVLFFAQSAQAATVTLKAAGDTTLHEFVPENNMGAFTFESAGATARREKVRALFRFDLSDIPQSAEILSASLTVDMTFGAPLDLAPELNHHLHRVLRKWGEGRGSNAAGNLGVPALAGESSWAFSVRPARWESEGGDFDPVPSATVPMLFTRKYTFEGAALTADVRLWRSEPELNFGWLLKSDDETIAQSGKRFGARESESRAELMITYEIPQSSFRITSIRPAGQKLRIEWTGAVGPYVVQTSPSVIAPTWSAVATSVWRLQKSILQLRWDSFEFKRRAPDDRWPRGGGGSRSD